MLGCNELNPWIRDVYNVTLKNGTSTDELPGHLNLCFFDTIVVSAWSVFASIILLYIMYHLTKHHDVETYHKKWSKSIVRWRYVNLILPSILFVLSSIVLFEDTYLPRFDEKAAYMEGYDLKTTNRGLIIGSTAQCLNYMIVLVSVYLSSTDRQIWHVPRGIRWWILAWTVASFVRLQCTIEAIVGYESMINWPFGELNDVENQKFIQWLRLIRFVFLFIYSIAILGQRDTPSFGFDVSPSDEQLRLAMKEDSEQEETKVSTLREPLLEDAESDDEENVETKTTSTVRFDPSWLPQDAPRGADRILRRVHSFDTRSEMHERVNQKVQRSDEMGASIFESLTFSWMNDQVRAGKQAPLQTRQLHLLHGNDLPDINAEKMLEMYRKLGGGEKCDETFRKKASVAWTIFYVYKWPLLFAASLST